MGNALGVEGSGARKFLAQEPNWQDYYVAEWRSERSKELDRHGGPERPPVARGDSVTAKLVFLENALRSQQKHMKNVLQVPDDEKERRESQKGFERPPDVVLNTDLRALERLATSDTQRAEIRVQRGEAAAQRVTEDGAGSAPLSPNQQRDFSLLAKDPELRRKMAEQRRRMLQYAAGVNAAKGAPGIKPLNLPAIKSKVAANWKENGQGGAEGGEEGGDGGGAGPQGAGPPAEWRVRIHAARRRALLLVSAAAKWQVAMSRRPGPKRLPRVNSFSYYIPQVLGDAAPRFIEEAQTVAKIKAEAEAKLWAPEARPEEPRTGEAQPADSPAREPPPGIPARPLLRRGLSDNSFNTAAAAAAVAAVDGPSSADAAVGAGVSARASDTGVGAGRGGGGGAAGPLASGMVRPRKRELLRSASDKAMKGASDADLQREGVRRPLSGSSIGATRLPAIGSGGGRMSSTGVPGDATPPPAAAPRPPRYKLGRIHSAAGQGQPRPRGGRRQSDSALALAKGPALPPSVAAAAAAADAAGLPGGEAGAAGGSPSVVNSPGVANSAVAAVIRGARARGRSSESGSTRGRRGSENGLSSPGRQQPTAALPGGVASDATAGPGLGGAGMSTSLASPKPTRRSEVGGGGGSGGPPGSPGFLPPLAGGGGGGGGNASGANLPGGAPKGTSMAQIRRMALLADVTCVVPEEGQPRLSLAGSPSRLGPLKLPGLDSNAAAGTTAVSNGGILTVTVGVTRSPEVPLVSPGTVSILDQMRPPQPSTLGNARESGVAAGGSKELREALAIAVAVGGASAPLAGLVSPASQSPGRLRPSLTLEAAGLAAAPSPDLAHRSAHSEPTMPRSEPGPAAAAAAAGGPAPPSGVIAPLSPSVSLSCSDPAGGPRALPPLQSPAPPLPDPRISGVSAATSTAPAAAAATAAAATPTRVQSRSPDFSMSPQLGRPPLPPLAGRPPVRPASVGSALGGGAAEGGGGGSGASPYLERLRSGRAASAAAATAAALNLDPEAASKLAKAQQLMNMYANRVNAMWAESQHWAPPNVVPASEQEAFCSSDAWVPYKVNAMKLLRSGGLAVHIDACEDAVTLADGSSMDVWTSDPWVLVQKLRPGSLPMSERIEGLPLGARVLRQLVLAVEALAGREAVGKLQVVIAINDDQRNAVVADIIRSRAYGLKPENLILTAQRKRCGYRYDRDAQTFLEDPSTPAQVLGSGYSLCQLAWLGDAFCVGPSGELTMLMGRTLLERFAAAKVEWLLCRRARDLALLVPEGLLDLQSLAFALYAADRHSGNVVLQAAPAASLTVPRAYDSTLLALKSRAASASGYTAAAMAAAGSTPRRPSMAGEAAGVEGGGGAATAVDLRAAELSSPVMVEALATVKRQAGHEGWVGLQRYLIHMPTLHGMLNHLRVFRPKLTMHGDVARLSLDVGDITADPRVACVPVEARSSPAILISPSEVDDLIPLLQAQDRSAAFRDILASTTGGEAQGDAAAGAGAAAAAAAAGGQGAGGPSVMASKPGIRIVLFVAANEVTQLAVNLVLLMARPGRDVVHLVTVVHNSLAMTTGQALVLKYLKQISNAMIEAHAEVLVKGLGGLLEVMEGAVSRLAPQLVVMASAAMTLSNLNTASVMGSVTLSVLKRLSLPVAVATSNSKSLVLTQRRTALRCMAVVEATARPTLGFLCSSCMEPMRGDRLVLAAHHPTRQMTTQQAQTQRRLLDSFSDIASSHRFHSVAKLQLDGPVDKALAGAAEEEAVHLVGLQVPLGTKGVPGHVLGLIRSCRGAVMVYRDTQ